MNQTGILLIHGLMGSPREYTLLESVLAMEGYKTRAIALPGHGVEPDKYFHEVTAEEILAHCWDEYHDFANECEQVFILGHSLGGICTLVTAAEQPKKLAGIVALSAPYEHAYTVNRMFDWFNVPLDVLVPGLLYVPQGYTGFERPLYGPWMYPKLLQQANYLFSTLQEKLPQVNVPVFLGHSRYDLTIPYSEMEKIALAIGNPEQIRIHTFERCGHQIFPYSKESEKAAQMILQFLNHVMENSTSFKR